MRETRKEENRERQGERDSEPQPPFDPSVGSLCHPCVTTTKHSYRVPIFETSATTLRGTTGIGQTSLDSNLNLKHGKMCLFVSHPFLGLHVSRCMQHVFRFYAIFTSLCAFCRVVVPTQPFTNTALYYKMLLESEPTPPAAKCFWGF